MAICRCRGAANGREAVMKLILAKEHHQPRLQGL
jgi:hypothetical protein